MKTDTAQFQRFTQLILVAGCLGIASGIALKLVGISEVVGTDVITLTTVPILIAAELWIIYSLVK